MNSPSEFFKIYWKTLTTYIGTTICIACTPPEASFSAKFLKLDANASNRTTAQEALGLSPDTYVCVLGPYRDEVDKQFAYSGDINAYLHKSKLSFDEGKWTVIYGERNQWSVEQIRRRDLDLVAHGIVAESSKSDPHVCDFSNRLLVIRLANNQISFNKSGEK